MPYLDILEKRIGNALKFRTLLKKCHDFLLKDKFEDFGKEQELLQELFDFEEELSGDAVFFKPISDNAKESENIKKRLAVLGTILKDSFELVESNRIKLQKMSKSVIREENSTSGNALSKYYPPQKLVPKFIDLES